MNQLGRFLLIWVQAIIVFASCKKSNIKEPNEQTTDRTATNGDKMIANAKTWFAANIADRPVEIKGALSARQKLRKTPDWDAAYIAIQPGQNVITVPLLFEREFSVGLRGEKRQSLAKQSKLLIFKDNGNLKAEVVTYIPNSDYLEHRKERFSGLMTFDDWSGNTLRSYYADNGKYQRLTAESTQTQTRTTTTCYYLNHYECDEDEFGNLSNCEFTGSEFIGCRENEEPIDWIDPGDGSGGGGGDGDNEVYEDDVDALRDVWWTVLQVPGISGDWSYEVRFKGNKRTDKFKSINPFWDVCSMCDRYWDGTGTVIEYTQTKSEASISGNADVASHLVQGTVKARGTYYPVNQQKTWVFSQVFN